MFKFTLYLWAIVIMIIGFSIVPTWAMVTALIVGATAGVLEVKRQKWMKERKRKLQKRHDDYKHRWDGSFCVHKSMAIWGDGLKLCGLLQ